MRNLLLISTILLSIANRTCADKVPGVMIDHQKASTREYVGSPSIVIAPNGNYVATHDLFGPGSSSTTSAQTKVFVSDDRGASWKLAASFNDQFWSNLFVVKKCIYLMGTSAEYGHIVIRTSDDNGASWSAVHFLTSDSGFHTAPVPIVVHDGLIYRAFEHHPTGPWGAFQAFMMWASIDSDLANPSSWSFSNRVSFPAQDEGNTWLEGNAVIAPDGAVLDILRVDNLQKAAILKLAGTDLRFERFVDFPGGATKFTIRFDPVSKRYWALTNPALPGEVLTVSLPSGVRNTLALMSSPDLVHWTPRKIVFHHPDSKFHAFQYVDWQFDGSDIILASRTAFDDAEGGANTYHNANFLTFFRIHSFRQFGSIELSGSPLTTAEVFTPKQIERWSSFTATKALERPDGTAIQPFGNYSGQDMMLTTRTKTGDAEEHRFWSDLFVVISGEASLVTGGHLIDPHATSEGELRGSGITGGFAQELSSGSIVHIVPGIPHQLLIPPNGSFTYFVYKVKSSSLPRK